MFWRRIDLPGHEIARLDELEGRWKLSGTAIFAHRDGPARLDYAVICDAVWCTKSAEVRGGAGDRKIDFEVSVDAERRWHLNGVECAAVRGCIDIDLGFSPPQIFSPFGGLHWQWAKARRSGPRGCRFHRWRLSHFRRFIGAKVRQDTVMNRATACLCETLR